MVYRFIDEHKKEMGVCWLLKRTNIRPVAYYNYLKDKKAEYRKKREDTYEAIKYIFFNNGRVIGYRTMQVSLAWKGIYLSKNTVHKYMV